MKVNFVFDGPPGPEGPRFVEVETLGGQSLRVGKWLKYPRRKYDPALANWWVLQVDVHDDEVEQ